jgi:uncharacterized protein (TIGR02391 family)
MVALNELFSDANDLVRLKPEELAAILIELRDSSFVFQDLKARILPPSRGEPNGWLDHEVELALAEALSWLEVQGLIVRHPKMLGVYLLTRQGRTVKTRVDLEEYRKGRDLPLNLLQPLLRDKVHHLFIRGDYETAVFQAFKEVEVAVRKAGNFPNDKLGVILMRSAFHTETGPLTDRTRVTGEREAEAHLFAGAIGYAKNPPSHRNVDHTRLAAAQLIVFASHLLDMVEQRVAALRESNP